MVKLGLFSDDNFPFFNELFKELSALPFNINENYNLIEYIFKSFKTKLNSNKEKHLQLKCLLKFEKYFNSTWKKFFENNIFILIKFNAEIVILKIIIKELEKPYVSHYKIYNIFIVPFLNKKGSSIIPLPLYLSFNITDKEYYRNIIEKTQKNPRSKLKEKENKFIDPSLIDIEEINEEKPKLNSVFLKYDHLSCQYDSYMLLQCFVFNDYFIKHNIKLN